ncbi:hypothetical protein MMC30_005769 [Trapelia coarctata]|nr:hypothetical protein [Trapelia coarctata]
MDAMINWDLEEAGRGQEHDRIDIEMQDSADAIPEIPPPPPPPQAVPTTPAAEQQIPDGSSASPGSPPTDDDGEIFNHPFVRTSSRSPPSEPPSEIPQDEHDSENSEDDSTYDEDDNFWDTFREDESNPSEEEMQEMSRRKEVSALDHHHWENIFYEKVDDPEHTVEDVGRITWVLDAFHGTREHPNRLRVMKSPSVGIGGFKWNIKLLPKGDETTDQVSVYIECTGPVNNKDITSNGNVEPESMPEENLIDLQDPSQVTPGAPGEKPSTAQPSNSKPPPSSEWQWDVAAQFGCVMYNPTEPRVQVYEKSAHHFDNGTTDWGWVRFHGPWNTIHRRQHLQRQPLLRNDTVAFTAYIRTFKDQTKALWWHQDKENTWSNLAKTGYRSITASDSDTKALAAGLSAWVHLKPFRDIISKHQSSGEDNKDDFRIRPLFDALQRVLKAIFSTSSMKSTVTLDIVESLFDWYDWQLPAVPDVIEIWDALQHILNLEYYRVGNGDQVENILGNFVTFRQIDYSKSLSDTGFLPEDQRPKLVEPRNTQEVLNCFVEDCRPNNKLWSRLGGLSGLNTSPPLVLQLELHRQDYDINARKWKRLTHRIEMNERVIFNPEPETIFGNGTEYTLYGMVIHSGKLGSSDYYTVIRPGGPGSQWVQFGGVGRDQSQVSLLTTKQAIEAHEGFGKAYESDDPVAYVVIYLRSDALACILPGYKDFNLPWPESVKYTSDPDSSTTADTGMETTKLEIAAAPVEENITVHIFDSDQYVGWSNRGFMDPLTSSGVAHQSVKVLHLPPSTTLREVHKLRVAELDGPKIPDRCWLYPMIVLPLAPFDRNRFAPGLCLPLPDSTLSILSETDGICRLWQLAVKSVPGGTTITEETMPSIQSDDWATTDSAIDPPAEDVVMGGTQDLDPALSIPPPPTPPALSKPSDIWARARTLAYFFVKYFDPGQRRLVGTGDYFAYNTGLIGQVLTELGQVTKDEKYDLYAEINGRLVKDPVSKTSSFVDSSIIPGTVLVVVKRPKTKPCAQSIKQGSMGDVGVQQEQDHPMLEHLGLERVDQEPDPKVAMIYPELFANPSYTSGRGRGEHGDRFSDIAAYYGHLESLIDPSYSQPRGTSCFFGSGYVSAENKGGVMTGHCIRIDTAGDAYFGNIVLGMISGPGTMYYANGDDYTGDWADDLPNGQGQMVYGKTGNTYMGGWKNGKRHGKGTMHFEVADEDLEICRICYELEMDALFFRCGHVVACEECARQVKDCPVCRKPVDAVVKIWKT